MRGRTAWAAVLAAALALGGCDYVRVNFGGGNESNQAQTGMNMDHGTEMNMAMDHGGMGGNEAEATDAGVTTSRSLQPRQPGGGDATGGKDPGGGSVDMADAAIDPAMIVGRWADDASCQQVFEFYGDGTFRAVNGARGNWRLDGNRLTLSGGPRSASVQIRALTPDLVEAVDANGRVGRSVRC